MKFKKDVLQELAYTSEKKGFVEDDVVYSVVKNEQVDSSRWSSHHDLIFIADDKFYSTYYSKGLTESQDESPFEYEPDEIECIEVIPVEKTVVVTEYVSAENANG